MEEKSIDAIEVLSNEFPDYLFVGHNYLDEESVSYSIGVDEDKAQSNAIRIRAFVASLEILKQELIEYIKEEDNEEADEF